MKVDVITRHSVPNYGSLLQSYATQKVLENLGYECEIIDYTRYDERYKNLVDSLIKGKKWDKNAFLRIIYKGIQKTNYGKMYKEFANFRKNFLNVTPIEYGNIEELQNNLPIADVYCSGSDQIWGKIGKDEYDPAYFLEFVNNKKCIAYSSSFGTTEISENLNENLDKMLKKYTNIFVREDSAKKMLENRGYNNVKHVLDPTLLLPKEDWGKLARGNIYSKKYVLVYQLHANKEFNKYAKEFAKKTGLKLLRITPSFYHIVRGGKIIYLPDQYELLKYFKNAEYILTDSFHATVFSIIFNKKFIDILPEKTSTRITSMLKFTRLEERILKDFKDFSLIEKEVNFEFANKVIEEERKRDIKLLKDAIEGNANNIDLLNKKQNCCGCRACEQICPKSAIKIIENKEGFFQPQIDKEKCINCGLCLKICPQYNKRNLNDYEVEVYAAKNKDIDELLKGSSGSIFSVLANKVLEENGTVYGVAFNKKFEANHIRITEKKELYKIMGSKYVQSNTNNTFSYAKKDLESGIKVLYSGTPCQIAGLKSFLGKDYMNLITVDVVCHGVPSQKLFKRYIEYLENKYKSKILSYEFRNKEKNGWGKNIHIHLKNGKDKYMISDIDPYFKAFLNTETCMNCCYKCKYANTKRVGDITLADFWGIESFHPEFVDENGISAIIINTMKGKKIFDNIKNKIEYIKSNLNEVMQKNENLVHPSIKKDKRNNIYEGLESKNFYNYIKENLQFKIEPKDAIKQITPHKIKKFLKKYFM